MTVLVHPYFLLGVVGLLAFAVFAARTSYVDTPTVEAENSDVLGLLSNEVERARRLGYPLTVARLILRPATSPTAVEGALRSIDTAVANDDVVHLLMPGCTDIKAVLQRLPHDNNIIAAWSTATFPVDALTIGELMLKLGESTPSQNGSTPSTAVDDRTSVT